MENIKKTFQNNRKKVYDNYEAVNLRRASCCCKRILQHRLCAKIRDQIGENTPLIYFTRVSIARHELPYAAKRLCEPRHFGQCLWFPLAQLVFRAPIFGYAHEFIVWQRPLWNVNPNHSFSLPFLIYCPQKTRNTCSRKSFNGPYDAFLTTLTLQARQKKR